MNRNLWLVAGIGCTLVYCALRIYTYNGAFPAWAAALRSVALLAAGVCLLLSQANRTGV